MTPALTCASQHVGFLPTCVYFDDCVHCSPRNILSILTAIWSCCDAAFKICSTQLVLLALKLCTSNYQYGNFSLVSWYQHQMSIVLKFL